MSRRDAEVRRALDILTEISPRFREAWQRSQEHRYGPASAALDRTGTSGAGPSDPTATAALTGAQTSHDHRTRELDDAIRALTRAVRVIDVFVRSQSGQTPTERDRREAERANTPLDECDHCTPHRRAGHIEPIYRGPTDVAGNLPGPMSLCRFCYDRVRRTGALPSRADIALNTARKERVRP